MADDVLNTRDELVGLRCFLVRFGLWA